MNDATIDPGYTVRVQIELLDGDRGGNVQPQTPVMHECNRSDLLYCIRKWTGQPNPQRGVARGDRQAYPSSVDPEGAAVEPDWHQAALAPRETGALRTVAESGRREPRVGVPLKD
jgi:hypothetical protein